MLLATFIETKLGHKWCLERWISPIVKGGSDISRTKDTIFVIHFGSGPAIVGLSGVDRFPSSFV